MKMQSKIDYAIQMIEETLSIKIESLADGRVKAEDYPYVTGEIHGLRMAVSSMKQAESSDNDDIFDD
jgi:hypothetical protein